MQLSFFGQIDFTCRIVVHVPANSFGLTTTKDQTIAVIKGFTGYYTATTTTVLHVVYFLLQGLSSKICQTPLDAIWQSPIYSKHAQMPFIFPNLSELANPEVKFMGEIPIKRSNNSCMLAVIKIPFWVDMIRPQCVQICFRVCLN